MALYHLPDYTEPEPTRRPRPPEGEGEATRNNVVMSAGKRSCPDIICYLLSDVARFEQGVSYFYRISGARSVMKTYESVFNREKEF